MTNASSQRPTGQLPEVRNYLDARRYLADVYEAKCRHSRDFSYSQWAKELGFESRSFVRMVVTGKRRITENSIPRFIQGLKLNRTEADYFAALVRLTQAENLASREFHAAELHRLRRKHPPSLGAQVVHDHYRFLSSHHGPKVQTLLTLRDLRRTPANLAHLLGLSEPAIAEILETLDRLGLARIESVSRDGQTEWDAVSSTFEVKTALGDVALQSFHRRSLEEAARALDEEPSRRRYHSLLLPLSRDEYAQLLASLQETMDSCLARFQSDQGASRTLYQLNLNVVPVSQPISRSQLKILPEPENAPVGPKPARPFQGSPKGANLSEGQI